MNTRHALGPAVLCATLLWAGAAGLGRIGHPAGAGPDLETAIASTRPNWPRRDVVFTVTVKNVGDAPCPRSGCRVLIRNAHPPRQTLRTFKKDVRALDPGDRFLFSYSIKLGLGLYEIEAAADADGKIAEADETNNKARLTIAGQ